MRASQRFRVVGTTLLLVGMIAATFVYFKSKPEKQHGILGVAIRTNRDTLELERMGGKLYVLFSELNEWFVSLWHGRKLAYTIAVLSLGAFMVCHWLAENLAYSTPIDKPTIGPSSSAE